MNFLYRTSTTFFTREKVNTTHDLIPHNTNILEIIKMNIIKILILITKVTKKIKKEIKI